MFKHSALAMLAASTAVLGHAANWPNEPVHDLDLQRYAGSWHEIAHLPMFFQRHCLDSVTATYTPRADGMISVRNACRTKQGQVEAADGVAKKVDGQPGALKVRFAPDWLSWLPAVWADYWVIELDPNYQWAVVGSPSRKYLWILARAPRMQRAQFETLRSHAEQRGYDLSRLVMTSTLN